MIRRPGLAIAIAIAATGCSSAKPAADMAITVAAASDLRPAFDRIAALTKKADGVTVTFTYGSSGQLAEQIVQGAPFDVFASADSSYAAKVLRSRGADPSSSIKFATGRVVMWVATGPPPATLRDLVDPKYRHIVLANPEHAPYGRAAKEALLNEGIWEQVKDRLVLADNVSDAMRIAQSGNADVGLVALSLVKAAANGQYTEIAVDHHQPLNQMLVITG